MTLPEQELESVIPDLRDVPMDQLADLGDSVLAHSIATYRQRLKGAGVPLNSFTSYVGGESPD
ncbi:MAG: FXSXX-COOH protein [Streptosporangiaceae bacterium]|nr:FXSXX-COOH protein [Streptosporangiaceae bacterium]